MDDVELNYEECEEKMMSTTKTQFVERDNAIGIKEMEFISLYFVFLSKISKIQDKKIQIERR